MSLLQLNRKSVVIVISIAACFVLYLLLLPHPTPSRSVYPRHTHIVTTMFWVGEILNSNIADGSQVCSAYDTQWAKHWSGGIDKGPAPRGTACAGSPTGGCDGLIDTSKLMCAGDFRIADNNYFPKQTSPSENPFYLALPFDDINDPIAFSERCKVIPWAEEPPYVNHCDDKNFSYMKNRWVQITGPTGHACYGQIEDAGPSHGDLYHDDQYVFGNDNARPIQEQFDNSGIDTSPALYSCLGLNDTAMQNQQKVYTSWQFVDEQSVPIGPWRQLVTRSGVTR